MTQTAEAAGAHGLYLLLLHLLQDRLGRTAATLPDAAGKDLKKWHAQPRDLWIIFTRRGADIEQYPAIQAHLEQYRERLEPKPKEWPKDVKWLGRKAGPYQWFEIQDTVAYYREFEKPKIQYGHFSPSPLFHHNTNGSFSNDKSYIIPTGDLYLYGLLNSSAYWFLIKALCPFVRGGYFELRAQYIETLPIPKADSKQKETIASLAQQIQSLTEQRYQIENNFRRRLPDLCPPEREPKLNKKMHSWWRLDFPQLQAALKTAFKTTIPLAERNAWQDYFESEQQRIASLNQQIFQLEQQLDQAVYALFDLTADEIDLLQQNV